MDYKFLKIDVPVHKALKMRSVEEGIDMSDMIAKLLNLKPASKLTETPQKATKKGDA